MKRFFSVAALLLMLPLVAVGAAWLFRDSLAVAVANYLLRDMDFRVVEVSGLQPGRHATSVGTLVVMHRTSGNLQSASGINVTYDTAGIRSAQIHTITIDSAYLELPPATPDADQPASIPRITAVAQTLHELPLQSFRIHHLAIGGLLAEASMQIQRVPGGMEARLDTDQLSLTTDLNWHDQNYVSSRFLSEEQLQQANLSALPLTAAISLQTVAGESLRLDLSAVAMTDTVYLQAAGFVDSNEARAVMTGINEMLPGTIAAIPDITARGGIAVEARLTESADAISLAALHVELETDGQIVTPVSLLDPEASGVITLHWHQPITAGISLPQSPSQDQGHIRVSGPDMRLSTNGITAQGLTMEATQIHLTQLQLTCSQTTDCRFTAQSDMDTPALQWDPIVSSATDTNTQTLSARNVRLAALHIDGHLLDGELALALGADTTLSVGTLSLPDLMVQQLRGQTGQTIHLDVTGDGVGINASTLLLRAERLQAADIEVTDPELSLADVVILSNNNRTTASVGTGSRLTLPDMQTPALNARNTAMTLQSGATLELPADDNNGLHLQMERLRVELPALRQDDMLIGTTLLVTDLAFSPSSGAPSDMQLRAGIQLENTYTNLFSLNLWDAALTADLALADDLLEFNAQASLNSRPVANISGSHGLSSWTGQAVVEIPELDFDDEDNQLTDFISPLPLEMNVIAGRASGRVEAAWHAREDSTLPAIDGTVTLLLDAIGGYVNSIGFIGLGTEVHAGFDETGTINSLAAFAVTLDRVDVGLALEDIRTELEFDTRGPVMLARDSEMSLFGGHVRADRLAYDATQAQSTGTLTLDRIDIARILSLSAYQGIGATGIVSGELPLTISDDATVTITSGRLRALPPGGTIGYRDGPTNTGNSSLDLVYSALRNYRYSRLEADVDYMADGELLLAVRMEGIATELGQGQPINLNVNISDNIPDLLESLQAGRDIADTLEAQLRGQR